MIDCRACFYNISNTLIDFFTRESAIFAFSIKFSEVLNFYPFKHHEQSTGVFGFTWLDQAHFELTCSKLDQPGFSQRLLWSKDTTNFLQVSNKVSKYKGLWSKVLKIRGQLLDDKLQLTLLI